MNGSAPLLLAALACALACSGRTGAAAEAGQGRPPADGTDSADQAANDEAAPESAKPAPAPERLAESGLGVGERLEPFEIVDAESAQARCQVCEFASTPKIIAVGTLDDPAFEEDIKDIDAIVAKWGPDRVKAFAVIAVDVDGQLSTPIADREPLVERVARLRKQLDVSMPIGIPAAQDGAPNETWERHYHVTRSRTLMFADADGQVKWSAVAPEHLGALDQAIAAALDS